MNILNCYRFFIVYQLSVPVRNKGKTAVFLFFFYNILSDFQIKPLKTAGAYGLSRNIPAVLAGFLRGQDLSNRLAAVYRSKFVQIFIIGSTVLFYGDL